MKKTIITLIIGLIFTTSYSQIEIPEAPKKVKKVYYLYKQKSNYDMREEGVYADTLLIKYEYPNLNFKKVEDPLNKNRICGLLPYSEFYLEEYRKKFINSVYHDSKIIEGIYNARKKQAFIRVTQDNKEIREAIKKHFKDFSLLKESYTLKVKYKKEKVTKTLPEGAIEKKDKKNKKGEQYKLNKQTIQFVDDFKLVGVFNEKAKKSIIQNKVLLNASLNKGVVPETVFSNNDYGVEKIVTLFTTCELKSISFDKK